jgi:hypothetical protein
MFKRSSLLLHALMLTAALAATAATGQAQTMTLVQGPAQLINVNRCDPQRAVNMPAYSGFAPAFYPFTPYTWVDPYGFPYSQFPPTASSGTLSIDYMNVSSRVMTTIDFGLVARGKLVAEVRDVGKFSPKAEIKHQFGLDPNVFPLRTALSTCVPLHIVFADGTSWKNPHLPPNRHDIYKHHRH